MKINYVTEVIVTKELTCHLCQLHCEDEKNRYIREAKVEKLDYLGTSLSMPALVEKWTWTVRENFGPHEESLMYYCCGINAEAESGLLFPNHSTHIILVLSRVLLCLALFLLLTILV